MVTPLTVTGLEKVILLLFTSAMPLKAMSAVNTPAKTILLIFTTSSLSCLLEYQAQFQPFWSIEVSDEIIWCKNQARFCKVMLLTSDMQVRDSLELTLRNALVHFGSNAVDWGYTVT